MTSGKDPEPAPAGSKKDQFGSEYSPRDLLLVSLLLYASLCLKKVLSKPSADSKVPEGCDIKLVTDAYTDGNVAFGRARLESIFQRFTAHMCDDKLALKRDICEMIEGSCWVPDFTTARAATFAHLGRGSKGKKVLAAKVVPIREADKENAAAILANNTFLKAMYDFDE